MRLFVLSDTHGGPLPPIPDGEDVWILHAGDVYEGRAPVPPRGTTQTILPVPPPKRLLLVRGNHDLQDPEGIFSAERDATGRLIEIAPGLFVAGLGWCGGRWYDTPREADLEPLLHGLGRQVRRRLSSHDRLILLTHYPPRLGLPGDPEEVGRIFTLNDPADVSGTYLCIRQWIEEFRPALVVIGHIHEWAGRSCHLLHTGDHTLCLAPGSTGMLVDLTHLCRIARSLD